MPVYKDKKGRYFIKTYVKDDFGNSKQITKRNKEWVGRKGKELAQQEEVRIKSKAKNQKEISNNYPIIFRDIFYDYLNYKFKRNKICESTYITIKRRIEIHILPVIGDKNIRNLTTDDYINLQQSLLEKGLNIRYINSMHNDINATFKYAVFKCGLKYNIIETVGKLYPNRDDIESFFNIKDMNKINKEPSISETEWKQICDYFSNRIKIAQKLDERLNRKKDLLLLIFEYVLYMRIGEVQGYSKDSKKLTTLKTRNTRFVYFENEIANFIKEIIKDEKKNGTYQDDKLIFGYSGYFNRSSIRNRTQKAKKVLGITKTLHNHKYRHSGISTSLYHKADPTAVAKQAGHSMKMTLEIYNQVLEEANQKLIEQQNNFYIPNINL